MDVYPLAEYVGHHDVRLHPDRFFKELQLLFNLDTVMPSDRDNIVLGSLLSASLVSAAPESSQMLQSQWLWVCQNVAKLLFFQF